MDKDLERQLEDWFPKDQHCPKCGSFTNYLVEFVGDPSVDYWRCNMCSETWVHNSANG